MNVIVPLSMLGGCVSSQAVVVEDAPASEPAAPVEVTQNVHQEVHVAPVQNVSQEVHVHVEAGAGGGGGVIGEGALIGTEPLACPGLAIQGAGETRPGRALGMALLQVYAQPYVDLSVDGVSQGRTPLIAVGVDAGPRSVRLVNTELGYDCTIRLHAHAGRRYSLSVDVESATL